VLRLYISFVAFTGLAWAADDLEYKPRAAPLLAALSLVMVLGASVRFPGVLWTDEGYMVGTALGFNEYGAPVPLLWEPYEGASFSLAYMGLGVWLRVFGVSHLAARLFVLVLGVLTVGVTWAVARRAYGTFAAWGAVVLGLFGVIYLNVLRQDILVGLYVAVGLLLYGVAERRGWVWLHLLVGLVIGFSVDGHPLAYRIGVGFGVAYALEYGLRMWQARRFVVWAPFYLLAAGGLSGAAAYLMLYRAITPHISNLAQTQPFTMGWHGVNLYNQLNEALQRLPLLAGVAGMGAVLAARRNTAFERLLLSVSVVSVLVFLTLYPIFRWYYLAHLLPVLMLLAAGALRALPERTRTLAVVMLTAAGAGYLLRSAVQNSQDYRPALVVADAIREVVPPDTRFTGVDPFYLRMTDYPFFEQQIIQIIADQRDISIDEAWELVAPEAVALVSEYPLPPPPGLRDYIARHEMVRVRCWQVTRLGEVELFVMPPAPEPVPGCVPL
jgi:PAS domain-containing protein